MVDIYYDERKRITIKEQKKLLLDMLRYVDKICRDNNIKYSLIGGSLIGAVRHHGFIPWDDDIDIILTMDNYEKLIKILKNNDGLYQVLKFDQGGKHYFFTKLIDTRTHLKEEHQRNFYPDYGVFIDIFCYYPAAPLLRDREKQFKRIKMLIRFAFQSKVDFHLETAFRDLLRFEKNFFISKIVGYKRLHELFLKTINCYPSDSDYVISNWPAYGFDQEIQRLDDVREYIDLKFEDINAMCFKNYDAILSKMFGDYMKLPPRTERKSRHNIEVWWRDGYGKQDK